MRAPQSLDFGIAVDVRAGLIESRRKQLPARLCFDDEGHRLHALTVEQPEHYVTRLERALLEAHADDVVAAALAPFGGAADAKRAHVVQLVSHAAAGAAGAHTELVVNALVRRQGRTLCIAVDVDDAVAPAPLGTGAGALPGEERQRVRGRDARSGRRLALWLGAAMGCCGDAAAVDMLRAVRRTLAPGGALVVGADRLKPVDVALAAANDRHGVAGALNKNALARINRELGGTFDLSTFAHRAIWNEESGAVELHLESLRAQLVSIRALGALVVFERGETILVASHAKYDDARLARIADAAGFVVEKHYTDADKWYGVDLWRAR